MHVKSDMSSSAACRLKDECWQAMDHLRNALDETPPNSSESLELLELIRALASFIDTNIGR